MKIDLLLNIMDDSGVWQSIALGTTDMNATPSIAALGLSLADGKAFLAQLQTQVVAAQIAAIDTRQKTCPECQSPRRIRDYHQVNFRSLFGKVCMRIPRFEPLNCQCHSTADAMHKRQRWISAELEFVQSQLAATLPYARSAQILSLLLPVAGGNAVSTVREHLLAIGRRVDTQGLQAPPEQTSPPDVVIMVSVGLDIGYVRAELAYNSTQASKFMISVMGYGFQGARSLTATRRTIANSITQIARTRAQCSMKKIREGFLRDDVLEASRGQMDSRGVNIFR